MYVHTNEGPIEENSDLSLDLGEELDPSELMLSAGGLNAWNSGLLKRLPLLSSNQNCGETQVLYLLYLHLPSTVPESQFSYFPNS